LESLESTTSICEDIGRHLLYVFYKITETMTLRLLFFLRVYNQHFSPSELLQIIQNITKEQVIHILLNNVNRNPVAFAARIPCEMKHRSTNDLRLAKSGYLKNAS
jgi:hypothetical protein